MRSLFFTLVLVLVVGFPAFAQEVPNCGHVADMAAAIRAGNRQRFQDLSANATALEMQAARIGESAAPPHLGPSEVREGALRACLKAAR